ncbi:MAG: CHAT domain-containing protein [Polyangiales bacterium]
MEYLDFKLKVDEDGGAWRVAAAWRGGGATITVSPPEAARGQLRDSELTLRESAARDAVPVWGAARTRDDAARGYGRALFDAVFDREVGARFDEATDAARAEGKGVRVRVDADGGAMEVPWELLCAPFPNEFLACSERTPVVRSVGGAWPPFVRLRRGAALRMLVASASPRDLPPLDVQGELARLRRALGALQASGRFEVVPLEHATLETLQSKLRGGDHHLFHFIGHGERGGVMLEDEDDGARLLTAEALGALLADEAPALRLCVLNSCSGAQASHERPLAGVAQRLIARGVPAVVAMQFPVSDGAAVEFARSFYGALAEGEPLEGAARSARLALATRRGRDALVEWATPVVCLQTADGRIFDAITAPTARPSVGHDGVRGAAFSPDGRRAATLNGFGLRVWDLEKKLLAWSRGAPGHGAVAFSADGTTLATAGGANPLRLWRADTGDPLLKGRTVRGESTHVDSVALSADGRLVSVVRGGALLRWDARRGTPLAAPTAAGPVCVAASWQGATSAGDVGADDEPAAPTLDVLGRADGACEVWREGRRALVAAPHAQRVVAIRVSRDGGAATTVDAGGAVRRWDVATGATAASWQIRAGAPKHLSFGTDDLLVFTIEREHDDPAPFYALDLATGEEARHDVDVVRAWASPDGRRALCGSWNGLLLRDLASGRVTFRARGAMGRLGVAVTSEGHVVVPADGGITAWDAARGRPLWVAHRSAAFSAAAREAALLLVTSYDGDLRAFDTTTGRERLAFAPTHPEVRVVAVSGDGNVALSTSPAEVRLWDVAAGRPQWSEAWARGAITCAALDREGAKVAVGTDGGLVAVWREGAWRDLTAMEGGAPAITALAWSPDGATLAVGDWRGRLSLWEDAADAPGVERELRGWTDFCVSAVAWFADGRALLTGEFNGMLTRWDVAAGRPAQAIGPVDARVDAMALAPNGRWAASSHGDDGTVRLWDLERGEPLGALVTFMGGEWVAVDARGGYEASDYGMFDEAGTPTVALGSGDALAAAEGDGAHEAFNAGLPEG